MHSISTAEGADTQPTTMTPEPPPGSRWEQMLLRAGEAGEGEAVEAEEAEDKKNEDEGKI